MSQRPGLDAIRGELVVLRSYRGISQDRVSRHAKQIQVLPTVDAEMERVGLVDRDVAALEVIGCAIRKRIPDRTMRQILATTLNLDGNAGEELGERRIRAQDGWYPSLKTYARREEEAYVELASLLIRLDESPCPDPRRSGSALSLEHIDFGDAVAKVAVDVPIQPLVSMILAEIHRDRYRPSQVAQISEMRELLPGLAATGSSQPQDWLVGTISEAIQGDQTTAFDMLPRLDDVEYVSELGDVVRDISPPRDAPPSRVKHDAGRLSATLDRIASLLAEHEEAQSPRD